MIVWRLCKEKFADDLNGRGALLYGGRWNSPGHAVLYTASSLSLACLEIISSLASRKFPEGFVSLQIEIPDTASHAFSLKEFPEKWREEKGTSWFQQKGNQWIRGGETLSLIVPSVIIPFEHNILINPAHPEIKSVKILAQESFRFDPRLIK